MTNHFTITDAHVVEAYAPCGGFSGWRVEYTHADGGTTQGPIRPLSGYAYNDLVTAKRDAGFLSKITDKQRAAVQRLIEQHVAPGHQIIHNTTSASWIGSHMTVRCVAQGDDETDKSGFHVRIGARGSVKHLN